MPLVTSRKFVEQGLLPAAFIQPVFQLAVSLFPDEFFPEILGMTLYLEWEATPTLMPIVRLYQGRGIDPHFYSLHVAIDNITAGHGFLAQEAIKLYLQNVEEQGGATEDIWSRIWNGYVTWATAGDLGQDLLELTMIMDHKQIDLSYPMTIVAATILQPGGLLKRLRAAAQGIATEDALSTAVVAQFRPAVQEELRHAVGEQPSAGVTLRYRRPTQPRHPVGLVAVCQQRFAGIALSDEVKRLLKPIPPGRSLSG